MMAAVDRVCPPGFRAVALLGYGMVALGALQLAGLILRKEHYPISAAALAVLLCAGGAVLASFVRRNAAKEGRKPEAGSRKPDLRASDWLTAAAFALLAGEAIYVHATTGTFFPARMALIWLGPLSPDRLFEHPLPMMLAGSTLVGLGALATAALVGALWVELYARRWERARSVASGVLAFAGAVPYVAFALIVRALVCEPAAWRAAGEWLALRPSDELGYASLSAMAPGLLAASVALGLHAGRGLWSWLERVRSEEEASDSFRAAMVRGRVPADVIVRHGLWLRRRRDLSALLLGSLAAAILIDALSGTIIDSFRAPGFPTYPSLGAVLFAAGVQASGAPGAIEPAYAIAHAAVVLPALLLLVAHGLPQLRPASSLSKGVLRKGKAELARDVESAHGLPARPAVQWVLGPSGAGKTTLLHAWASELRGAALVPQDPDEALPRELSAVDVALLAQKAAPRGDRVLWDLLGRLDDEPLREKLSDPFSSVAQFSRGERQRLLVALGLLRVHHEPESTLLLDEPTSAQDALRTARLLACARELAPARFDASGALVIATHDPEPLAKLLGTDSIGDHVLWLGAGAARGYTLLPGEAGQPRWEGPARPDAMQAHLASAGTLLAARDAPARPVAPRPEAAVPLLRGELDIAGRRHAVSPEARIRPGELVVLHGPSGSGKSTLLRELARKPPALVDVGYVLQDPARAFPAEMPVGEALGVEAARIEPGELQRWYGAGADEALLHRPMGALSEGERQRVLLAGELMRLQGRADATARLRLLLLDEPFGAVDPQTHVRLLTALMEWVSAPRGRNAAVLVSHSPLMDLGLLRQAGIDAIGWTIARG